jgi:hypothetical protein
MPVPDGQMLDQQPDALGVVGADMADPLVLENVVDEHHRGTVRHVTSGCRHQQPIDLAGLQRAQRGRLVSRVVLGVHHHHLVAGRFQHVLSSLEYRGVERDPDVRHDHAHEHRGLRAQSLGGDVAPEPQCGRRLDDLAAGGQG